jgi:hypothetical protein
MPRSQHGYTDIEEEMHTIDQLGPLARQLFNDAPRELSALDIVDQYKDGRRLKMSAAKNDKAFAAWLTHNYRWMAGHPITDGVKRRPKASRA